MENKTNLAFENEGDDFFKSKELSEGGQIINKSIPTMPEVKRRKAEPDKKIPADVKKFNAKIEGVFKELDEIVLELINKKGLKENYPNVGEMTEHYTKFKRDFSSCLNSYIKNGSENEMKYVVENGISI